MAVIWYGVQGYIGGKSRYMYVGPSIGTNQEQVNV